jgi:hypothetical protein
MRLRPCYPFLGCCQLFVVLGSRIPGIFAGGSWAKKPHDDTTIFVGWGPLKRPVMGTTLPSSIFLITSVSFRRVIGTSYSARSEQDKGPEAYGTSPLFDFGVGIIVIPKRTLRICSMTGNFIDGLRFAERAERIEFLFRDLGYPLVHLYSCLSCFTRRAS